MHISWLGNTAIKIQTKPLAKDINIIIDPYKPSQGSFPRNLAPDIGLYTNGNEGSITLSGNPFTLVGPGECETGGVLVTSVQGEKEEQTMIRVDSEQLSVGHMGRTDKPPTDEQLASLSGIDILLIPYGGEGCYDAGTAVKVINSIEPRMIIPMCFKTDNEPKAKPVDAFLKELGSSNGKAEKKLIIKKKNLPQEETQVVVLSKE